MTDFEIIINELNLSHYVYIPNKRHFKFKNLNNMQKTFLAQEILSIMKTIQEHDITCEIDRFHNIQLV